MRFSCCQRWLFLPLALLVGGGCARTPEAPPRSDPDAQLAAIIEYWNEQRTAGAGCGDSFESGRPVLDCGRLLKALDLLAVEFPRHPGVLFTAATLAREDGRPEKAQSYLGSLFTLRPVHPAAAILRARIAMDEGNLPLAERTLKEQILFVPDHAGLRETFASVAYLRKDWEAAEERLRAAERLGAPDWRVAYHRGLVAEAQGRTEEASAHYRRSIDARPGFERARSRLAGLDVGSATQ